ncbi:MAG: methylenetetrahydrofolate reductase [Treponema sp.]|jgi:methylenetetrahydrofolate reductase (NADPH)|nr:methylenetetrahydrofolate reductase [Treponema sp.]
MKITEILKKRMTFSFEVFPPKENDGVPKLQKELDELFKFSPDFISCTYGAGGTNVGKSQEICKYIADNKVTCMTHFTCIGTSEERILKEINEYIGIGLENVLAMRGDFPKDPNTGKFATTTGGVFSNANQLIEFIKANFGDKLVVAAAGDPETHILAVNPEADIAFIRAKQDAGAEFIMCQLCHDIDEYERWVAKCRKAGVTIPFVMGLMPVLARDPIINMTVSNGCSIPKELAAIIGKYTPPRGAAENVVKEYAADFKKAGMEYTVRSLWRYMNTDLQGIHLYALNKAVDVGQIVLNSGIRQKKA